jgi:hypothetical protein
MRDLRGLNRFFKNFIAREDAYKDQLQKDGKYNSHIFKVLHLIIPAFVLHVAVLSLQRRHSLYTDYM